MTTYQDKIEELEKELEELSKVERPREIYYSGDTVVSAYNPKFRLLQTELKALEQARKLTLKEVKEVLDEFSKSYSIRVYNKNKRDSFGYELLLSSLEKTQAEAHQTINDYIKEAKLNRNNLIIEVEFCRKEIAFEELKQLLKALNLKTGGEE